ncbi:hypothetical protein R1sor_012704 [Riccia sorocarpa]|uniref:Uncharacterized protein n=1 Tax=Riccia sorocarpa TaxID=122646 RepID=A0ABD3I4J3_9MARC
MWTQWFQPPKSIKDHACTSAKYKACESMSDNTIRFISKDSFTRRDETTRLGVGRCGTYASSGSRRTRENDVEEDLPSLSQSTSNSMDYWAHYFNEQLFIDPVTCARPIEYDPRAKVHPDGPQKVSKA